MITLAVTFITMVLSLVGLYLTMRADGDWKRYQDNKATACTHERIYRVESVVDGELLAGICQDCDAQVEV